jgi:hypothetical protein
MKALPLLFLLLVVACPSEDSRPPVEPGPPPPGEDQVLYSPPIPTPRLARAVGHPARQRATCEEACVLFDGIFYEVRLNERLRHGWECLCAMPAEEPEPDLL